MNKPIINMNMRNNIPIPKILCAIGAVILIATIGLAPWIVSASLAKNAPVEKFSGARALKHIAVIAQSPHPPDSERQAEVRATISADK
jgi:hypothetical protein